MSLSKDSAQYLKCPHCACIFFTQADLDMHLKRFGNDSKQHVQDYKESNLKIEYGYGSSIDE